MAAGGGVLLHAACILGNVKGTRAAQTGVETVRRACEEPLLQISGNAGFERRLDRNRMKEEWACVQDPAKHPRRPAAA